MFATQPPLLSIMNFSAIALCLLGAAVIIAPNACTASAASIESKSAKSDIFFSKSSKSNKSPKSSKSNKSPKSSKSESAAPTFGASFVGSIPDGAVLCPGKPTPEYCDCSTPGDCTSDSVDFCDCDEANEISCCAK